MTIKTQQRVLLAVIGIIFTVMVGIAARSNWVTGQYRDRGLLLTEVIKEVFEFNIAAGDYLLRHNDRALEQMERRIHTLAKPLERIRFVREGRVAVLVDMQRELALAGKKFDRLKELHTAFHAQFRSEINEDIDAFSYQEIQDLSASLSISAVKLVTSAQYLLKLSAETEVADIGFYERLLMGGMIVSFALLTLAAFLFSRRFVLSIGALTEGAARIAAGDMTTRLELTGNDELTDLTRSLNEMTQKLQGSYEALEDEIEERTRTEESLLESEQQLRVKEEKVRTLNLQLESRLLKLQEANREMESFTYSVSHDLRAPLRHLTGFVEMLNERDTSGLDEKSRHYLDVISSSAMKMGCLIDDLLSFSRMGRGEMMETSVDMKLLTREVVDEISENLPQGRVITWHIGELPVVTGDRAMLRLVLVNLISNAVKFSGKVETPLIEVDVLPTEDAGYTLFVRDNGAGFNMKYADKLFGLFQRLHSTAEYEGTGVGLANVHRIIARHNGRTWAEGELGKGATFYFTLPNEKETQP